MAVITIDGVTLTADDNQNVLEAALDHGIYIPHLCHHKDLNPLGSCRMCIVEVEGQKGVVPSCELKAADGLIIHTKTEEINRLRMLGLELLLAGHPEECTTCPKYGNCELQMLIQYIGPKTGRLKLRTKGFKEQTDNPLIIHDMNRCVLCGRCVRACNELRGVGVLQYQKRDMETYIGTLHDKLLKDADCRFCGACAEVCPTGTIRDKLMDAEMKKEDAVVPCRHACPAHTDIPRYIRHVKNGEYDEAGAVLREKLPFPKSLGYICTHVCELACKRKEVNEAMSIREIKRFATEHDSGIYWRGKGKHLPETGKKVCVVGGGPSGLSAAYYLQKQGHEVTVKEELPTMGGMMAYGIPAYRMPREIVKEEVDLIVETGVHMETNVKVESPELLLREYDAVLMAIGGHKGVVLPMEGHDLDGVLINTQFLRKVSMNQETKMGDKVVVLGGGNVAFDCARSAVRLGAETVHVACLEKREAMTADNEEIEQAIEEGIHVHSGRTFERITGETKVTGVELMKVKSFTFDENRRAVIEKEEGSEHCIEADTVIFAVGQRPDITEASGLDLGRGNSVKVVDIEKDKQTSVAGIFAAGDVIYGTKSVIMAVQSGKEAASQIDRYLGGDGDISEVLAPVGEKDSYIGKIPRFSELERKSVVVEPAEKRRDNFKIFDYGICESDICGEASRCLQCDLRMDISKPRVWGDYAEKTEV